MKKLDFFDGPNEENSRNFHLHLLSLLLLIRYFMKQQTTFLFPFHSTIFPTTYFPKRKRNLGIPAREWMLTIKEKRKRKRMDNSRNNKKWRRWMKKMKRIQKNKTCWLSSFKNKFCNCFGAAVVEEKWMNN